MAVTAGTATLAERPRLTCGADYDAAEILHRGDRTIVLRTRRRADGAAVVLKCLDRPRPGPGDAAQLRWEATALQRLAGPGVARGLGIDTLPLGPAIVLADARRR